MRVGVALNMLQKEGRSDADVFAEHMALGDLAEPLGFDSLFALEHHFTGYAMSPSPTQLLSYYAGRTRRITLGTAVIVLPWHDPVRVAEQIALLDVMSGGRCIFGFGRGAASVEYAGFRIPMEEARPRFAEAAQIVVVGNRGMSGARRVLGSVPNSVSHHARCGVIVPRGCHSPSDSRSADLMDRAVVVWLDTKSGSTAKGIQKPPRPETPCAEATSD